LALFLGVVSVFAGTVGAYWGIARARAPLGAAEPQETIDRRIRFKAAHLGQAKTAVAITGVLLVAAVIALILTSV
jgi:hypothetical protein